MPLLLHEESQDLCTLGPGLLGLTTATPFGCDKRYQKCPTNTATTSVTQAVRKELVPRTKVNTSKQPASYDGGQPKRPRPSQDQESNKSSQAGTHLRQENAEAQRH